MSDNNQQEGQINIEFDKKTFEGIYFNLAIINHYASEFVIDFINQLFPCTGNFAQCDCIICRKHIFDIHVLE